VTVAEIREATASAREDIEAFVAEAPPLSPAQAAAIATLLRPERTS